MNSEAQRGLRAVHFDAGNTLVWLDHAFLVQRLDVAPGEFVYAGDIYGIDVVGARGAGMRAFPVDRWAELDCERIRGIDELPDRLAEAAT